MKKIYIALLIGVLVASSDSIHTYRVLTQNHKDKREITKYIDMQSLILTIL